MSSIPDRRVGSLPEDNEQIGLSSSELKGKKLKLIEMKRDNRRRKRTTTTTTTTKALTERGKTAFILLKRWLKWGKMLLLPLMLMMMMMMIFDGGQISAFVLKVSEVFVKFEELLLWQMNSTTVTTITSNLQVLSLNPNCHNSELSSSTSSFSTSQVRNRFLTDNRFWWQQSSWLSIVIRHVDFTIGPTSSEKFSSSKHLSMDTFCTGN